MTIRIVLTAKKNFNVIQRDDVTQINVDATNWTLHAGSTTAIYPVADYNLRILGVKA